MATRLVFASKWTEKRYHCKFECISKIKLYYVDILAKVFKVGFFRKMQFVEKQHTLTLKALIPYYQNIGRNIIWYYL